MIGSGSITKLCQAIDNIGPVKELVNKIKKEKNSIYKEIDLNGFSMITFNGQKYKITKTIEESCSKIAKTSFRKFKIK